MRLGKWEQGNMGLLSRSQTPSPSCGVFGGTCTSGPGPSPKPQCVKLPQIKTRRWEYQLPSSPANWCQAQQHKGSLSPSVTNPSASAVSIPSWVSVGAAGSCLQPRVHLSFGIIPHKLGWASGWPQHPRSKPSIAFLHAGGERKGEVQRGDGSKVF